MEVTRDCKRDVQPPESPCGRLTDGEEFKDDDSEALRGKLLREGGGVEVDLE